MLTITPSASKQLQRLLAKEPGKALRVFVSPGGCSGMQYGMTLDDQEQDGDQYVEADGGVRVVVDEMSAGYLEGCEIDFADALMGGGFQIQNPNAVKSCACGHSFDTGKDATSARACHA